MSSRPAILVTGGAGYIGSDLATIIRTAWAWHKKAHPLKTGTPVRE
jgi:nucleoside-diphosphate-sugar epimerase